MADLRFLADMNISPFTVSQLRKEGFTIVRVSELMPSNTPDEVILPYAIEHNYILITQDLDFSEMLALLSLPKPSVINVRLVYPTPMLVFRRVMEVINSFEQELLLGCVISVDEISARYRLLPMGI